jgi:hypothetical protein
VTAVPIEDLILQMQAFCLYLMALELVSVLFRHIRTFPQCKGDCASMQL